MKKLYLIIGIIFVITLLSFPLIFKKKYLILLKKDGIVTHYNNKGKLQGEVLWFKKGIVEKSATFQNGVRNGWAYTYYADGKVCNRRYYKFGILDGPEQQYYKNGKLNYKGFIQNNKRIGSIYWFLENGKLNSYSAFNIKGEPFCTFDYNGSGSITNMEGFTLSPLIYSVENVNKSVVLLQFRKEYHNIRDLYINVATPPTTKTIITANINGKDYVNLIPENSLIHISNAFVNNGLYTILIKCTLLDKNNKIINGLNSETTIIKN